MSSRRGRLCLVLIGLCLPRLLPAQAGLAPGRETDRLTARLDSLATLWREANAVADMVDSLAHRPAPIRLDSLRIGGLSLIVVNAPIHLPAAADSAWRILDAFYGAAAATLAEHPYRIAGLDSGNASTEVAGTWGQQVPRDLELDRLTQILVSSAPIGDPDPAFHRWLGDAVRPAFDSGGSLSGVYTALVTSPFSIAHDCFLGDVDGCRSALNLNEGVGALTRRYRTPEDRRLLISRVQSHFEHTAEKVVAESCLNGGDTSCVQLLQAISAGALVPPLPPVARASLVQFAVRLGGREAYQRLAASAGRPVSERLGLAAAMPVDSLLRQWRDQVIRHRPEPVAVPIGVVSVGLGWIMVFGMCGLRSSRWRVG